MTVAQVKATIGGSEFVRWQEFNEASPLDSTARLESMIAQLTALTYNTNKGKGASKSPKKFLPKFGPRRELNSDQMLAQMDALYNGLPN